MVRGRLGWDRIAAARLAISCGATAIVLDDGFQHRRLSRSLDIVLLNAEDPWEGRTRIARRFFAGKTVRIARAGVVLLTRPPELVGNGSFPRHRNNFPGTDQNSGTAARGKTATLCRGIVPARCAFPMVAGNLRRPSLIVGCRVVSAIARPEKFLPYLCRTAGPSFTIIWFGRTITPSPLRMHHGSRPWAARLNG